MKDAVLVDQWISGTVVSGSVDWISLGITWAHILGGFLIIIGLLTRWAVLLQIPILIGAVIFINYHRGLNGYAGELVFAFVILLMLILFLIEGGGPISLDDYIRKNPR